MRQANRAIYRAANEDLSRSGMGTTLTFLYFMQGHVMLAHVGDSRCYLMRGGEVYQITKDHSLVAELVRKGEITEEEAKDHPYRNIITRGPWARTTPSPWTPRTWTRVRATCSFFARTA